MFGTQLLFTSLQHSAEQVLELVESLSCDFTHVSCMMWTMIGTNTICQVPFWTDMKRISKRLEWKSWKKYDSTIFIHIPSQPQPAWHYETLLSFVRLPIALPQQCQGRGSGQSLSVVRIQLLIACSWAMRVTCDLWCASFKGYFSFFWSRNFSLSLWWSIKWLVHVRP